MRVDGLFHGSDMKRHFSRMDRHEESSCTQFLLSHPPACAAMEENAFLFFNTVSLVLYCDMQVKSFGRTS